VSYRPITDVWILARPKVKYYGAYPNGFLERARVFMPVTRTESVLHVCGGLVKLYPTWSKLCPNDITIDIDPECEPDVVYDVREDVPSVGFVFAHEFAADKRYHPGGDGRGWRGILIDRPYTPEDAKHYRVPDVFPPIKKLLADALSACCVGGRVGVLDYVFPRPPNWLNVKLIAKVSVTVGYDNRDRCFSVFERLA
jgi:hypothetical protein